MTKNNQRPFGADNPVNGFSGASTFSLANGRNRRVGYWRDTWRGSDFDELRGVYHSFVAMAKDRVNERIALAQVRGAQTGRVVIRESDERAARADYKTTVRAISKAQGLAEGLRERAASRREGLRLSAADIAPGDFAGAIRRERIRQKLEAMDAKGQREALKVADRDVVAALAEMPLGFSPVPEALHLKVLEDAFERENADVLRLVAAMEEAAETALRAADAARAVAREALGDRLMLDAKEVEPFAADLEATGL